MPMSEAELLSFASGALLRSGLVWFRVPVGGVAHSIGKKVVYKKSPLKGMTDLFGLTRQGAAWFLELKTIKGRVSPDQLAIHEKLKASNAIVAVARTPQEVLDFIRIIQSPS